MGVGKHAIDLVLFAEEMHVLLQLLFADEIFSGATVRPVPNEHELCGRLGADLREDFDSVGDAFYRTEIREMHKDGLTGRRPFGALRGIRLAGIEVAIDEVRNDFDGSPDVEFLEGLVQEILRDGSDAIAL